MLLRSAMLPQPKEWGSSAHDSLGVFSYSLTAWQIFYLTGPTTLLNLGDQHYILGTRPWSRGLQILSGLGLSVAG